MAEPESGWKVYSTFFRERTQPYFAFIDCIYLLKLISAKNHLRARKVYVRDEFLDRQFFNESNKDV